MANSLGSSRSTIKRCGSYRRRPIELRSSFFQQRSSQLELFQLNDDQICPTTNFLRLSNEYLQKCRFATFASTRQTFHLDEFRQFLRTFFSFSPNENDEPFSCHLCQNRFHSKKMFDLHFQRQSVSIEYRCLTCHSLIQTSNPCQAFEHLLTHVDIPEEQIRLDQLTINFDRQRCFTSFDQLLIR